MNTFGCDVYEWPGVWYIMLAGQVIEEYRVERALTNLGSKRKEQDLEVTVTALQDHLDVTTRDRSQENVRAVTRMTRALFYYFAHAMAAHANAEESKLSLQQSKYPLLGGMGEMAEELDSVPDSLESAGQDLLIEKGETLAQLIIGWCFEEAHFEVIDPAHVSFLGHHVQID
jgi:transcriptional regulator of heat shock response